jgi:hypothetical protein
MSRYRPYRHYHSVEVTRWCRRCKQRYRTVEEDPDNLCLDCAGRAAEFEAQVALGFIGGRYPDFSVFELFGEKICRVVLSRDERGEIDNFVEFCAPHIVYAAAAIRSSPSGNGVRMMTKILRRKSKLILETPFLVGHRPVIVHVEPFGLRLRTKHSRQASRSRGRRSSTAPQQSRRREVTAAQSARRPGNGARSVSPKVISPTDR